MIKPLNNHCLIEVIDENEGLVGATDENVQKGILKDFAYSNHHLTTSTGYLINGIQDINKEILAMRDTVVYWQEYADSGSKFTQDGKEYVLIPFYRIIGYEENK